MLNATSRDEVNFVPRCTTCDLLRNDFHEREYLDAFTLMKDLVEQGEVTFFAGSCPLDEVREHLKVEDLYIIEHFFKCRCGSYFYTGYCVRGTPKLKVLDTLPNNFATTISGRFGEYFAN